jgi:hypothetical protein
MQRRPRPATGGVDAQLRDFEDDLRNALYMTTVKDAVTGAFLDISHRYSAFPDVINMIAMSKILIQAVATATERTLLTATPNVVDDPADSWITANVFQAYWDHLYYPLRDAMIEANHHVSIIQRTWKRCVTDPEHPACRRRLEWEFNELSMTSGF